MHGQTAGVHNIFRYRIVRGAGVTNVSPHYNLPAAIKIYIWRNRLIRSSSASQKDCQLVVDNDDNGNVP